MSKSEIIDADKLVGKLDMSYDLDLANFEACEGKNLIPLLGVPSPREIERRAERYLAQGLAEVLPAVRKEY